MEGGAVMLLAIGRHIAVFDVSEERHLIVSVSVARLLTSGLI